MDAAPRGFVVDASVAVKWVVVENDSDRALGLLSHYLVGPDLLLTECANILWKAVRRGEIVGDAIPFLWALRTSGVELMPSDLLLEWALRRALALRHPVYDCLYLAAAAATGLPLVTADRRLARLSGDGAEVILLSDLALPPIA